MEKKDKRFEFGRLEIVTIASLAAIIATTIIGILLT